MPPIYLDHNATTPVDSDVMTGMLPFFSDVFGNPSSVTNWHGARASEAIEGARAQVASAIGAKESEIIFTGGCTEANNLAILGIAAALPDKRHFITSAIEHPSVFEPLRHLQSRGAELTIVPVDSTGVVDASAVAAAIRRDTALVSIMGANNEVGALQPLEEIGEACAAAGVALHADLAQLPAYEQVDVRKTRLSLASLSAHKAYGPKGIGALYLRSQAPRTRISPIFFGGGQERGVRPGTVNVPLVVGMGLAFDKARRVRSAEAKRLRLMRDRLFASLHRVLPDSVLNGPVEGRLANNLSVSIPGVEPYALMRSLRDTVSFSASSACASDTVHTSHVLLAMFGDTWRARNAFRLGLGRLTSDDEVDSAAEAICSEALRLRRLSREVA